MNLGKKKALAVRALKVGKERVSFVGSRLEEIKEAITKQDIRDLHKEGAIIIKAVKGRKKNIKKSSRRRAGTIRKKITYNFEYKCELVFSEEMKELLR